jgi:PAS domain S-box-containing protein
MKKISIKVKLIFWITLIILFFGSFTALGVYIEAKKKLIGFKQDNLLLSTIKESSILANIFDNSKELVNKIAQRQELADYILEGERELQDPAVLNIFSNYNIGSNYSAIYLLDQDGLTLVSTDPSFVDKNYAFRDYFKLAISGKTATDVAVGVTSQKLGFYFASPIKKDNLIIGVVVVKLEPNKINLALETGNQDTDGDIAFNLVDEFGVIMAGDEDRLYKSLGTLSESDQDLIKQKRRYAEKKIDSLAYEELQKDLEFYSQTVISENLNILDKQEKFVILNRISPYPFYILAEVQHQDVVLSARKVSLYIAANVLVAAICVGLMIYWLVTKLIAPIMKLKMIAESISEGNFSKRVNIKTGDEIEDLAKSLNKMIDKIVEKEQQTAKKVKHQTYILQKQAQNLEGQREAMLNALKDAEEEKEKSLRYAKDLQKFQLALSKASDLVVITDNEGIIVYANPALEAITDYKIKDVIGKKAGVRGNWGGNMNKAVYEQMWKTIKKDKKMYIGEVTNKKKSGIFYIAEIRTFPILDEKGDVQFFVAIERDITKAKEVDRMKTEFISLVSHQLRTPLSAMKWFLEMMLAGDAGKLTKTQEDYVSNVNDSNERMIELVNSLLNVSRIEAGKIIVEPKLVSFPKLVDEIVTGFESRFEEKKQQVNVERKQKIPRIKIDPKLIHHVLMNLLSNASKYTPNKGKITITIDINDRSLICSIKDTGYGIPESQHRYIFSKFFRGDNIVAKETDGTGLGLYLAKLIVEASGGAIWFKSTEDKGSTFTFTLPLKGSKPASGEIRLVN